MTATLDWVITYEQVAHWLDPKVRFAIEEDMPCTGGSEHAWDTAGIDDAARYPFRECRTCAVVHRNPEWQGRKWSPSKTLYERGDQ